MHIKMQISYKDDHKNVIWHGGRVCEVTHRGFTFILGAYGDVEVELIDGNNNQLAWVKDRSNAGWFENEMSSYIHDDAEYLSIRKGTHPDGWHFEWHDNNWWEVLVDSPDGKQYDTGWVIDDDNIDDAIASMMDGIEAFIAEHNPPENQRGFEPVSTKPDTKLPTCATTASCGYDFYMPHDCDIKPGETVKVYTGVKAYMQDGEGLILLPRSSTGKLNVKLANTIGLGEADFYDNPQNEGEYVVMLRNENPAIKIDGTIIVTTPYGHLTIPKVIDATNENTIHLHKGDRVIQGMFIKTLRAYNGNTNNTRIGGIGSTN